MANVTVEWDVNVKGENGPIKVDTLSFEVPDTSTEGLKRILAGEKIGPWDNALDFYADAISAAKVRLASQAKARYLAAQKGEGRSASRSVLKQIKA